jgi:hypothetical protein
MQYLKWTYPSTAGYNVFHKGRAKLYASDGWAQRPLLADL